MRARFPSSLLAIPAGLVLAAGLAAAVEAPRSSVGTPPTPTAVRTSPGGALPALLESARAPLGAQARTEPPYSPGERELLARQAAGEHLVADLVVRLQGLPEGPERQSLQARIEAAKRETRAALLVGQAQLARARGDDAHAQEAEAALDRLLHPERAMRAAGAAVPVKSARATGGAR